jgi:hypothetical protein
MAARTRVIPRPSSASRALSRRRHKRYPAESVLAQVLLPGGAAADALPLNLSPSGAGLVLPGRFEPGTVLTLRLCNRSLLFGWTGRLRLTHCQPMPDGRCAAGGSFLQPLPPAALRALLRSAEPVSPRHRRAQVPTPTGRPCTQEDIRLQGGARPLFAWVRSAPGGRWRQSRP